MLDRPCAKSGCQGKLQYANGVFVYEHQVEFKVISNYYLVGEYIRQNKKPLNRETFHPQNRTTMK